MLLLMAVMPHAGKKEEAMLFCSAQIWFHLIEAAVSTGEPILFYITQLVSVM